MSKNCFENESFDEFETFELTAISDEITNPSDFDFFNNDSPIPVTNERSCKEKEEIWNGRKRDEENIYTFEIRLNETGCGCSNDILLDYVPEPYSYVPHTLRIDGKKPKYDFLNTSDGSLAYRGAFADESIRFDAKFNCGNATCGSTSCCMNGINVANTPMTCLSTIVERVGDLPLDGEFEPENNCGNGAKLHISQKVFTTEKGCKNYDIFEFTIENRGNISATAVMFEDEFPCNVSVLIDKVKLNCKHVSQENILKRSAQNILISLPDICPKSRVVLTVACDVFCGLGQSRGKLNFGKLFYVSNFKSGTRCNRNRRNNSRRHEVITIHEAVSNSKKVCIEDKCI